MSHRKRLVAEENLDVLQTRTTDTRYNDIRCRQSTNTDLRAHCPIPLDARSRVLEHMDEARSPRYTQVGGIRPTSESHPFQQTRYHNTYAT